jgi:uncharacterized protein (TIGR00661 family)
MKILYAIQGTGNGHLARAIDLVPEFTKYGEVDVLLSGKHCELELPFDVRYRVQGLGFFFGKQGGIDLRKTWRKNSVGKFFREVMGLPVHDYDLVISDFEPVSAWACRFRGKACYGMSHQSAVTDLEAPRPTDGSWWGEIILKYYAPATQNIGFHFRSLNRHIFTPIIRKSVRELVPGSQGHYTVYLPAWADIRIISVLAEIREVKWEVFSKNVSVSYSFNNVSVRPVESERFLRSIACSVGVLCNAGFETPLEALFLGKKLCVIPMKHQYEQACNAEMLKSMGVLVLQKLSTASVQQIRQWTRDEQKLTVHYPDNVPDVVERIMEIAEARELETSFRPLFPFPSLHGKMPHVTVGNVR